MRRFIATVALVSLLALTGCAQEQVSSPAHDLAQSTGVVETHASGDSSKAESAGSAQGANVAETHTTAESSSGVKAHVSFRIGTGDMQLTTKPADTEAARVLIERLQEGPITVSLHAYGGFEQVGSLPWSLPTSDGQVTTSPGDIMLYQGNQISIFTGSNSWAYTPLGSIEDATPEMLLETFGGDAAEITLSIA